MAAKKRVKAAGRPVVFNMTDNLCVWSQAGVIKPVLCMNAFNCMTCPMDKKIQGDIAKGRLKKGRLETSVTLPGIPPGEGHEIRKCRHMLSGRVTVKYCTNTYNCANCPFDQLLDEEVLADSGSPGLMAYAGGFAVADHYYYHWGHAWARVEYGGRIRVGLDDFAARLLGPLDEIRLPALGATVQSNDPFTGLVRGSDRAAAMSPVDGVVVARNAKVLANAPDAHGDPYGGGWFLVIEPVKLKANLRGLLYQEECRAWMEEESTRLSALVSDETGYPLAAAGGRAVDDICGHVPEIGWDRLVREFLKT